MNTPATKRYIVTVELRGPAEVVTREWSSDAVKDADDAFEMTFTHMPALQQERVVGHNVVEAS